MTVYEPISSFQNPRVKLAQKLHDKPAREREKLFVIDDSRDLSRAVEQEFEVEYVLYNPSQADEEDEDLVESVDAPIFTVPTDILAKASYRQNPGGLVAVLRQKPRVIELPPLEYRTVLVLVDLRKPGNIGALLRTAEAAGIGAVLLVDTALDLYNPNIIRSSTGACFLDTIYTIKSSTALDALKASGYQCLAGHLQGATDLYDVDFQKKSALVLGTEDIGLNELWSTSCDVRVRIPMMGHITDSLNVSVSGALLMYEALRQNR